MDFNGEKVNCKKFFFPLKNILLVEFFFFRSHPNSNSKGREEIVVVYLSNDCIVNANCELRTANCGLGGGRGGKSKQNWYECDHISSPGLE